MTFLQLGLILFPFSFHFCSRASAFVIRRPSFLQHPFPDVRRTVQDREPLRLTCIEKANTFEIDKTQFLQIQNDWRFAALDFGFDLIQLPNAKFTAEPKSPLDPFNPQRHFSTGSGDNDGSASRRPFAIARVCLSWTAISS